MRSSGTLMCLGSGAAFGAMAIFGKLAYGDGATVGTLLAVRFALAALAFWAVLLVRGRMGEVRALQRREVAIALGLGLCGYALQAGCYFLALERIDASLLALLLYTFPAIVAVAAFPLGGGRLGRLRPGAGAPGPQPRSRARARVRRPRARARRRGRRRAGRRRRRARPRRGG